MQQRYVPILVVFVLSILVAGIGYLAPAEEAEKEPVRILLENEGGKVVFDHKVHAENYNIECVTCHHEMAVGGDIEQAKAEILSCGSCHGIDYNEEYIASHTSLFTNDFQCATCHHYQFEIQDWGHDFHSEMLDCTSCHHTEEIEPEPQNCADCHSTGYAPIDDPMPSFKNAVHERCMPCHQDLYDEGLDGCKSCHSDPTSREKVAAGEYYLNPDQATCKSCHEGVTPNELIPDRITSFHASCMGCHEVEQKGPYKPDQCAQCHQ